MTRSPLTKGPASVLADTFKEEDLDDVVIEDLADGDVKAPTIETAAVNNAMESFMFRETN